MDPKVYYPIQNHPPTLPILSQTNPVHDPSSHFLNIRLNIILPSTPRSPKLPSFLQISPPIFVHTSSVSHTCHMSHPSHYSCLITRIIFGEQYSLGSYSLCILFQSSVTLSILEANIFLCTLFSNTLHQCSFFNV